MFGGLNLDYKFKIILQKIDETNLSPPERPGRKNGAYQLTFIFSNLSITQKVVELHIKFGD